jgi:hypothetical protein
MKAGSLRDRAATDTSKSGNATSPGIDQAGSSQAGDGQASDGTKAGAKAAESLSLTAQAPPKGVTALPTGPGQPNGADGTLPRNADGVAAAEAATNRARARAATRRRPTAPWHPKTIRMAIPTEFEHRSESGPQARSGRVHGADRRHHAAGPHHDGTPRGRHCVDTATGGTAQRAASRTLGPALDPHCGARRAGALAGAPTVFSNRPDRGNSRAIIS